MSSESTSFSTINDLHSSHHQHYSHPHQNHPGPSGNFHTPSTQYLGSGYNSYMNGIGSMSGEGPSNGMGAPDMGVSSFTSVRNPLKRAGEDLDSLANGAGRMSPRERERERERIREQSSMSEEQAQALRRPASFPVLGPNGASAPYMGATPGMSSGAGMAGPSTPSGSGFLPSSTSDSRFRNYGGAQGTPSSVGPAPPMSTPFNFTPRSPYDESMAGPSSIMHTPASHQHGYPHSHSHSYSQSSHTGHPHDHSALATSTPPPPMGVPTGVPDFMRNSHTPLDGPAAGMGHHHMGPYGSQNGFDADNSYQGGRSSGPMPIPGSLPQPTGSMSDGAPRASLEIEGDLERQVFGWDHEEWTNGRRLLQFWRRQEGTIIHASFKTVMQREYDQPEGPRGIIISCIFRPDKNECFITSVDLIYLLESLINNRFTVEEKNRIRRNLEGFRPITISKNKPDCSAFFKRIMSFPAPKPRNIEKDVKVFAWASLRPALCKIVGKYYASYTPGNAAGPAPGLAMGHEMGPGGGMMNAPGSNSPMGPGGMGMPGGPSIPLGVVGVVSRTPSLEQQIHRGGSGASMRSPLGVGAGATLQGSPAGGNANTSLGAAANAMSSITSGNSSGGPYSHSHPLSLQGGSAYGGHGPGDYHAPHSTSSTPTPGPAGPGPFPYGDYMPQSGYGHGNGMSGLNGVGPQRNVSDSSSNPPSGTAGSVGLGLGPSPMPPPPPSTTSQGSNYVYSPSATGTSGTGGGGGGGAGAGAYSVGSMLGPMSAAPGQGSHGSGSGSGTGNGSHASPGGPGGSNAAGGGSSGGAAGNGNGSSSSSSGSGGGGGNNSFPVPVIGGGSGDVSNEFASGILPAPQPGRARGLSATLAGATSGGGGGFRRS